MAPRILNCRDCSGASEAWVLMARFCLLFFLGLYLLLLLGEGLLVALHRFHGQLHKLVGGLVVAALASRDR
jgi:hypothetical protein